MRYLRGERTALMRQIERDMKNAAAGQDYESAVMYRNQLQALKQLGKQIIFSDKESVDISKDEALYGLSRLLSIKPPRRIEGYDISHMQGTDTVASMVVFINGLPEKSAYRKFKMRLPGNDDFLHMAEVIRRRFSQRRKTGWDRPSLCVIDGGKGQLHAALQAQNKLQDMQVPMIGLAKRFEEIIVHNEMSGVYIKADMLKKIGGDVVQSGDYSVIHLPDRAHIIKLLQRIRDESHRFAVSYHTTLKRKRTTVSKLDDMPGIGPSSKKKLLRAFGSVKAISEANTAQITAIVGSHRAKIIKQHLD